jgi:Family of unknown function (DUF6445)
VTAKPDVSFNPRPQVQVLRLATNSCCYVIDDVLRSPEQWQRYAIERQEQFVSADASGYPGVSLAVEAGGGYAMRDFFNCHLRRKFDARRTVHTLGRYSLVTLAPEQLRPGQWLCHQDPADVDPSLSRQACVLYLFHDSALGGTSFYEPTRSAAETSQLLTDADQMNSTQFTERYGIRPAYLCDSNAYFRRVATVPARWNRVVFYSGALFHSGQIEVPERLSADPTTGRLTVNFFFSCRRNLSTGSS